VGKRILWKEEWREPKESCSPEPPELQGVGKRLVSVGADGGGALRREEVGDPGIWQCSEGTVLGKERWDLVSIQPGECTEYCGIENHFLRTQNI
jgi:hypothetical protein